MTPISTPPLDALAGISVPAGKPPAPPEAAAVNWFLTWLGQLGDVPELTLPEKALPEETEAKTPPAAPVPAEPLPQQVQWLTLLLSVPAFQQPPPAPAPAGQQPRPEVKGKDKQTASAAPLPPPAPAETAEPEIEPEPDTPKAAAELPVTVPIPASVELPKPPAPAPTPQPREVQLESHPATPPPAEPPAPASPPPQPVQTPDKGEVIWSAELLVKAPAAPEPPPAKLAVKQDTPPSAPAHAAPVPAPANDDPNSKRDSGPNGEAEGGARRQTSGREEPPAPRRPIETPPVSGELPANRAAPAPPRESPQPANPAPESRSAPAEKAAAPARREPRPPGSNAEKALDPKPLEATPPTGSPAQFHVRTAAPRETQSEATPSVTATSSIELDPPKPLRAAQIATVQVDVPPVAGDDSAAPMRLIVSQRGEQVNVRLRSWDPSTPPLEASRMEPLLHSLAEKGFSPATEPSETNLAYLDRPHEKTLAAAESFNTGNDQQNFLGADDRQQQNQERQQQQQAFFLRKQMRNLQSGDFDPGLVLGGNPPSQQGAVR